jgi:hypothetical protein
MTRKLRELALKYVRRGWSIIRIAEKSKLPEGAWAGATETRMPAALTQTFPLHLNIGIVTGKISRLAVIDFDPGKGATAEVQEAFLAKHPTDLTVRTGTGGLHAYYTFPEDTVPPRNSASILGPGVDVRGEGGMVVAPPSIHPNGNPYEWEKVGEPGPFPFLLIPEDQRNGANPRGWVNQYLAGVPDGTRDNTAAKLAGFFYSKDIQPETTKLILEAWGTRLSPPYLPDDVAKTVESVYRKADREGVREIAPSLQDAETDFELMRFDTFMAKHAGDDMRWIIKDWLPDKTIALVVSPPATRKTWATLDLCISVATGTKFLGMYAVEPDMKGPVLLLQQEDFTGQTAERLSVIAHARLAIDQDTGDDFNMSSQVLPEVPIHLHTQRSFRFDDKKIMGQFREAVEQIRPKLVVLDPLYSAASTEDFMAKAATDMGVFKDLRDKFGTTFVICHHTKKGADAKERERIWGSQFLNAFLETGWQFSLKSPTVVNIHRHFKAAQDPKEVSVVFDIDTEGDHFYEVREAGPGDSQKADTEEEEMEAELVDGFREVRGPPKSPTVKLTPAETKALLAEDKYYIFFREHPEEWFNPTQVAYFVGGDRTIASRRMVKWKNEGILKKEYGKYGWDNTHVKAEK